MFDKLKSRKFWFAFVGALLPIATQYLTDEVDSAAALQMSGLVIISYIFGQGYVDAKALEGAKKK